MTWFRLWKRSKKEKQIQIQLAGIVFGSEPSPIGQLVKNG